MIYPVWGTWRELKDTIDAFKKTLPLISGPAQPGDPRAALGASDGEVRRDV